MARLDIRISDELRALIDQVGPPSAAARALMVIGAHAAGYPVSLDVQCAALSVELSDQVRRALLSIPAECTTHHGQSVQHTTGRVSDSVPEDAEDGENDPFSVGIEV